jgi:hypothetical protein
MTATAPEVVDRYLDSAKAGDAEALAGCFTADGTVLDEGVTYRGREKIVAWRVALASKYTYTTTVTGSEPAGAGAYRVTVHLVGDFPGGEADLAYRFALRDGLIAALTIG